MKNLVLLALTFITLSASAFAGTCNITTISKAKYALSFSYGKSSVQVENLKSCIQAAQKKLGTSYTGTISVISSPNSNELPATVETEHKIIKVNYSYYDSASGIHYKGSLR